MATPRFALTIASSLLLLAALSAPARAEEEPPAAPLVAAASAAADAGAGAAEGPAVPSAEDANAMLVAGNARFLEGKTSHPHQDKKRVSELAAGQHPFVTVLSCSDSRVPPELLFDEGFGDVFSVRVAGNVANGDEMGSVEYGVDHLGTPLLVVLGHTKCGAVTAVATKATVHGHIPALVAKIGPAVDAVRERNPGVSDAELIPEAIKENVFESMATMLRESDAVRARVESGKTRMVGAVYDVGSGALVWLGPHPDQVRLVAEADAEAKDKPAGEHDDAKGHDEKAAKHGAVKHDEHAEHKETHKEEPSHPAPPPEPPSGTQPIGYAIVALLCTIGGAISARR